MVTVRFSPEARAYQTCSFNKATLRSSVCISESKLRVASVTTPGMFRSVALSFGSRPHRRRSPSWTRWDVWVQTRPIDELQDPHVAKVSSSNRLLSHCVIIIIIIIMVIMFLEAGVWCSRTHFRVRSFWWIFDWTLLFFLFCFPCWSLHRVDRRDGAAGLSPGRTLPQNLRVWNVSWFSPGPGLWSVLV